MAKVVRNDIDDLNAVLTVNLSREDYEPKFKTELNKYRKKAHIKGFRKGKTPMGFIKKMYGTAVLAEVVNELLQSAVTNHLSEEKLNILGQPLPNDEQEDLGFDANDLKDFTFTFDLGLAPEFELKGLDDSSVFERYAVDASESKLEEELMNYRKRAGERAEVEEEIEENDLISFEAEELDGDEVKENGWAATFSVLVDLIASEELKKEVMSKKKGDKVRFNVYELEKDRDKEYVDNYMLNIGESDDAAAIGSEFEAVIGSISRVVPASLDQEFFDKAFGEGQVKSEEEAKAKIEEEIVKHYDRQAESLLFRDFQDHLMKVNELSLPDQFLHRWIKVSNENVTDEAIEKEYDDFAKNLKWSLIRGKAVQKFDLQVNDETIFQGFKDRVRSYFGGYGDELIILNTANRLMEDEKQVDQMYQELISEKLFNAIREVVTVKDKKISAEDFEKELKAVNEAIADKSPQQLEEGGDSAEETEEEVTEDVG